MKILLLIPMSFVLASCASSGGGNSGGGATPKFNWPKSTGTVKINSPRTVTGTLDGGMKTYDGAGLKGGCGQEEDMEPMFILKDGARLKNIIIKNAPDGIHVEGDNILIENVFNQEVCEDAITVKSGVDGLLVKGSAFKNSDDKAIQVNGGKNLKFEGNYFEIFRSAIRLKKGSGKTEVTGNTFYNGTGAVVLDPGVSKPTMKDNSFIKVKYEVRQD